MVDACWFLVNGHVGGIKCQRRCKPDPAPVMMAVLPVTEKGVGGVVDDAIVFVIPRPWVASDQTGLEKIVKEDIPGQQVDAASS